MNDFFRTLKSEWIKQKRSSASYLIVCGALFVPAILLLARLLRSQRLPALYQASDFWDKLWNTAWESVTVVVLPMLIMLVASLLVQLEYRNNAWKQVHASPQSLPAIFFAKLLILLSIVGSFFVVFNLGLYLVAVVPLLFVPGTAYPAVPFPGGKFLAQNLRYFVDTLPIVALQYLFSLHFRNFTIPLGLGLAQWLLVIGCISNKYIYVLPYACIPLDYLLTSTKRITTAPPLSLLILSLVYFIVITLVSLGLYLRRQDKG